MTLTDSQGSYEVTCYIIDGIPIWYAGFNPFGQLSLTVPSDTVLLGAQNPNPPPDPGCIDPTIGSGNVCYGYFFTCQNVSGVYQISLVRTWYVYVGGILCSPLPPGESAFAQCSPCVYYYGPDECEYPNRDQSFASNPWSQCVPFTWSGTPTGAAGSLGDPVGGLVTITAS